MIRVILRKHSFSIIRASPSVRPSVHPYVRPSKLGPLVNIGMLELADGMAVVLQFNENLAITSVATINFKLDQICRSFKT